MPRFVYVDMACSLEHRLPDDKLFREDLIVKPVDALEREALYACYSEAFSSGDAKFYQYQSEEQKQRYFNEGLGFPEALSHPASFAYIYQGEVIGFALVLSGSETSYHVSCMCIAPEFQGQGLGKAMLNRIKNLALENGCTSITLGTEPEMKAYRLYKENGFEVTGEHIVDM